jgi:hypothetical protein
MSETSRAKQLNAEATKVLDEAIEALRRSRELPESRATSEALRDLETKLGYLAQSLSWEMDGETAKADAALRLAQGLPREAPDEDLWYQTAWFSH